MIRILAFNRRNSELWTLGSSHSPTCHLSRRWAKLLLPSSPPLVIRFPKSGLLASVSMWQLFRTHLDELRSDSILSSWLIFVELLDSIPERESWLVDAPWCTVVGISPAALIIHACTFQFPSSTNVLLKFIWLLNWVIEKLYKLIYDMCAVLLGLLCSWKCCFHLSIPWRPSVKVMQADSKIKAHIGICVYHAFFSLS